jgi:hypothetical protein
MTARPAALYALLLKRCVIFFHAGTTASKLPVQPSFLTSAYDEQNGQQLRKGQFRQLGLSR